MDEDDEVTLALMDSQYLHGLKAGWNCGVMGDEQRYQAIVRSREGYLAALKEGE